MPQPLSITSITTSCLSSAATAMRHGLGRAARLDRVLDEMAEQLLEAAPDRRAAIALRTPRRDHRMLAAGAAAATALDQRRRSRPHEAASARPRMMLRQAGEQPVHAARPNPAAVATMSARNSGLSAWRSALRAVRVSWLTRFLMSCRMKAKRRLNSSKRCASDERLLRARLGKVARHLAAGDAQQVEILPVERAVDRRAGEQDRAL